MKTFLAMISLLTLISAQAATISSKTVSEIEVRIENQKIALEKKVSSANTDDIVEGKVVAVMSYNVEVLLETAATLLVSLDDEKNISEKAIAARVLEINSYLNDAEVLIQSI